jgi:hypothetical protein
LPLSDLALAEIQAEALFTFDESGRLCTINEPGGLAAPRLFVSVTGVGAIVRYRCDLSTEVIEEIGALLSAGSFKRDSAPGVELVSRISGPLSRIAPVSAVYAGPAYRFPERPATPDGLVPVTRDNAGVLTGDLAGLRAVLEARRPCFAAVRDGRAVSVCYSSRRSTRAAEAGVETLPAYRGQGLAGAVTAAWAAAVQGEGLLPLYSTSWDNLASQAVARKLGLIQYAAEFHLT